MEVAPVTQWLHVGVVVDTSNDTFEQSAPRFVRWPCGFLACLALNAMSIMNLREATKDLHSNGRQGIQNTSAI